MEMSTFLMYTLISTSSPSRLLRLEFRITEIRLLVLSSYSLPICFRNNNSLSNLRTHAYTIIYNPFVIPHDNILQSNAK